MRKPRVYITNDTGLDFTMAEQHGELIRLTTGKVDPFRPHLVQQNIENALEEFDATQDFILPVGSLLSVAFTFASLGRDLKATPPRPDDADTYPLKMLLFDSKKMEYIIRTVGI